MIDQAIRKLYPDVKTIIYSEDGPQALDSSENAVVIDMSLVESKAAELKTGQSDIQYQKDRVTGTEAKPLKYAPNGDQLDLIYHAIDQGLFGDLAKTSEFYINNKLVKDTHEKPT